MSSFTVIGPVGNSNDIARVRNKMSSKSGTINEQGVVIQIATTADSNVCVSKS